MTDNKQDKKILNEKLASGLIGGLVGAVLVGGVGYAVNQNDGQVNNDQDLSKLVSQEVDRKLKGGNQGTNSSGSVSIVSDVSEIVKQNAGAVVSVVNLANTNRVYDLFGFATPSTAEQADSEYQTAGEGSGVIYKKDGDKAYLVTNNHVIAGSDALEVILSNGQQVPAKLVGTDVWTDLAVLEIPAEYVETVAEFGDSSALTVGEPAIAIGSPLGSDFASTVTQGIISGLDRSVPTDLDGDKQADWQVTAIQTDAAINPGNSGGALLNAAGQVIGINSMKISASQVEGMGFAIPSNDVQSIISQLESNGHVTRPELGIAMVSLNRVPLEEQSQVLNLPDQVKDGVLIYEIDSHGPAYAGGLRANDVITKFDGQEVTDDISLRKALYSTDPNKTVEIEYYRDGKPQKAQVKLQPQAQQVN
ncbi:serine protease [Aerococcus urinaehominis]|uniref:Serine protease n=1 Tax=Aerococcus urinaehominis TaxID=128944 RepID=A0A109RH44_9LACT|nr:S1C family serine protease [Aerococcus urinaehominis]AMB99516.1 serine protease [Aerococcus urinaehominis]SDM25683.1 serine protease Do [Aerococcus urinaehominis]